MAAPAIHPSAVSHASGNAHGLSLRTAVEHVFDWLERRRQRRQLAGLDDRLLKDIGVTRADVWRELHN